MNLQEILYRISESMNYVFLGIGKLYCDLQLKYSQELDGCRQKWGIKSLAALSNWAPVG